MANTVTRQTIEDGDRNVIVHVYIASDGAAGEETNTVAVDASSFNGSPTDLRLVFLHASCVGCTAILSWDATANVPFLALGEGETDFNYANIAGPGAGLPNNAGAGKTGDILISTTGLGTAGDAIHMTFHLRKS